MHGYSNTTELPPPCKESTAQPSVVTLRDGSPLKASNYGWGEEGHVNASRGPGERVVILIWSNLTVLVVSQAGTCNGSPAAAAAVEGRQSHTQWA